MDTAILNEIDFQGMTRPEFELFKKQMEFQFRKSRPGDEEYKPRMKTEMVFEAYRYLLENDCTVDEAFDMLVEITGESAEFVQKSKNSRYLDKNGARKVVNWGNDLQKQQEMRKSKTFDPKAMKKTTTPNATLTKLRRDFSFHLRLLNLEKTVEELGIQDEHLKAEIAELKASNAIQDQEIGQLQERVGLSGYSDKEKAGILKQQGLTQKQIASNLGKSLSTIKRWWDQI